MPSENYWLEPTLLNRLKPPWKVPWRNVWTLKRCTECGKRCVNADFDREMWLCFRCGAHGECWES